MASPPSLPSSQHEGPGISTGQLRGTEVGGFDQDQARLQMIVDCAFIAEKGHCCTASGRLWLSQSKVCSWRKLRNNWFFDYFQEKVGQKGNMAKREKVKR